jgi:uncharacterized protein YdeI (YjbR/CyaY-like superfamily)
VADAPSSPELTVPDAAAWREWLHRHHDDLAGVWLVLAKKGTTEPTRLSYDEALEEALCHGWIDGKAQRRDDFTFRQRFTPRRRRSAWSRRNVGIVERLTREGRMHPAGLAEVERAQKDGRWQAAYAGPATIDVPPELAAALRQNAAAMSMFESLNAQNRYAVLYRIGTAKRDETRARRVKEFVEMLARGETLYPQRRERS